MPRVSIIIVNTNELHHLQKCLPSIYEQDYDNYEILLIDNLSNDGSVMFIEREFPQIRVIINECNLGYAGANNVGFKHAAGNLILVLNPDTKLTPGFLNAMVAAMDVSSQVGLVTPKILLWDKPEFINACGNEISLTGLTFCRGLEQPAIRYPQTEVVSAVSGAAFMIRKEVLEEIGGFDESFFIYYEETDLSLRAMLAGYKSIYIPTAIVFHKYTFRFSPKKCFYQERNRYYAMIKTLRWPTFVALLPEILISEVLAWGYAAFQSGEHVRGKFQSWVWLWRNRKEVLEARQQVQKLRRVNDRALLVSFTHRITFTQTTAPWIAKMLGAFFNPLLYIFGKATCFIVTW